MDKTKMTYLLVILVLLVATAYLTTAFLIKFWPFNQAKNSGSVDLTPIADSIEKSNSDVSKPDFSKGVVGDNEDPYNVSDGTPYDCGLYTISFPKGWLVVLQSKGKLAISSDLGNSTNAIYVSQTKSLTFNPGSMDKTLDEIKQSLGSEYSVEQVDETDFLGKQSLTVSGSAQRNGTRAGLLAMAIPSDDSAPGFWVIGFFDPKDSSVRDNIVASMATMLIKTAR